MFAERSIVSESWKQVVEATTTATAAPDRAATMASRSKSCPSASSLSVVSVVAFSCCCLLMLSPMAAAMSLDRLALDRNEIAQPQRAGAEDYPASTVVEEDRVLEAVPAGGMLDTFMLVPAEAANDMQAVDQNTIEQEKASQESGNGAASAGDMLMMESQDAPMVQVVPLPEEMLEKVEPAIAPAAPAESEDEAKASSDDDEPESLMELLEEAVEEAVQDEISSEVASDSLLLNSQNDASELENEIKNDIVQNVASVVQQEVDNAASEAQQEAQAEISEIDNQVTSDTVEEELQQDLVAQLAENAGEVAEAEVESEVEQAEKEVQKPASVLETVGDTVADVAEGFMDAIEDMLPEESDASAAEVAVPPAPVNVQHEVDVAEMEAETDVKTEEIKNDEPVAPSEIADVSEAVNAEPEIAEELIAEKVEEPVESSEKLEEQSPNEENAQESQVSEIQSESEESAKITEETHEEAEINEEKQSEPVLTEEKQEEAVVSEDKQEESAVSEDKQEEAVVSEDKQEESVVSEDSADSEKIDESAISAMNIEDAAPEIPEEQTAEVEGIFTEVQKTVESADEPQLTEVNQDSQQVENTQEDTINTEEKQDMPALIAEEETIATEDQQAAAEKLIDNAEINEEPEVAESIQNEQILEAVPSQENLFQAEETLMQDIAVHQEEAMEAASQTMEQHEDTFDMLQTIESGEKIDEIPNSLDNVNEEKIDEQPMIEEMPAEEPALEEETLQDNVLEEEKPEEPALAEENPAEAIKEEENLSQSEGEKIEDTPLTSEDIIADEKVEESVLSDEIIAEPVMTEEKIEEPAMTEEKIEEPAMTEEKIEVPAMTEEKIEEPAMTEEKIEEPVMTEEKIEESALIEEKIEDPAMTEEKIEEPAMTEEMIEEPVMTEEKIEEPAMTEEKIEDPAMNEEKIEEPVMTEEKIEEPAMTEEKIEEPVMTEEKLEESAMDEDKIEDAITSEDNVEDAIPSELMTEEKTEEIIASEEKQEESLPVTEIKQDEPQPIAADEIASTEDKQNEIIASEEKQEESVQQEEVAQPEDTNLMAEQDMTNATEEPSQMAQQTESQITESQPQQIALDEVPEEADAVKEEVPAQAAQEETPAESEATIEEHQEIAAEAITDSKPEPTVNLEEKDEAIETVQNQPEGTSMLTTIIQVPSPEAPIQPQQDAIAPIKVLETLIAAAATPAVANPTQAPASMPVNVVDSVLNYVNASFMGINNNNKLAQKPQEDALEDESATNPTLRRYDGAQVWRIVVQNDKDKRMADELLSKYDGQLWKEVKQEVDYLLKPQVLAEAASYIRSANLSRIVLIDNLQKVIEVENPPADQIAVLQNRKGHRLTWQAYHRLDDIHGFFDYLAKTYPDLCSVETIGYSIQKRPLKILKISNGNSSNPGFWIDGGMHAREWISPATVTYIANQLVEGWEDLPEEMQNVNWYIHAVANPDGYEYSHTTDRLWRKNMRSHGRQCPGVDLNRNFGYKWGGKGTSANPCSQTYRGSKAFSEPETFYISKYISNFPRDTFHAYISFHSYGQYILYPWGYDYQVTKDRADLDRVARQAGTTITRNTGMKYTVGSSATTLYPAAGGSDDWAKGFAGIKYAYTIEMGDTGRYGFVLPAQFIEPNGRDGVTFVETVARAISKRNASGAAAAGRRRAIKSKKSKRFVRH